MQRRTEVSIDSFQHPESNLPGVRVCHLGTHEGKLLPLKIFKSDEDGGNTLLFQHPEGQESSRVCDCSVHVQEDLGNIVNSKVKQRVDEIGRPELLSLTFKRRSIKCKDW